MYSGGVALGEGWLWVGSWQISVWCPLALWLGGGGGHPPSIAGLGAPWEKEGAGWWDMKLRRGRAGGSGPGSNRGRGTGEKGSS